MNIPIVRKVLAKNDAAARENRERFEELGLITVNLLGGAGCGKTSILEGVIPRLRSQLRVGVLEGDLATTRDAQRIAALGAPVVQILTDGGCHLNATLVQNALAELPLAELDLLLIENVGNPICPANFDLGEHLRIAVLSVTEGDDKPEKYALLFKDAHLILLSKCDLLPHVQFDAPGTVRALKRLNPRAEVICTDTRTQTGLPRLAGWLSGYVRAQKRAAMPAMV